MARKKLKITVAVVLGLVVGVVLVRVIAGFALEARFESKVAELKSRGEPTTLADLVPPAVPDNENAATLYISAFEHPCFEPDNAESAVGWRVSREKPLSALERTEARRIVERAAEPLALLRKAADRRSCRFPTHYAASEHIFDTSGNAEKLDGAADLLLTAIYVNREDGKADDALGDCRALLAVSRVHAQELQAWFYGDWWLWDAARQAERVLDTGEPSETAVRGLLDALGDVEDRAPFVRSLKADRCFEIEVCRRWIHDRRGLFREWNVEGRMGWLQVPWVVAAPLAYRDASRYLDLMERMITLAEKRDYARNVKLGRERGFLMERLGFQQPPWGRPFTYYAEMDKGGSIAAYDGAIARKACLKTALVLRLHRLKNGSYPATLAELVPQFIDKVPTDPFSGKPLIYRREGKGFILYSVGEDGKDNGGVEHSKDSPEWDIVWKCAR